MPKKRYPERDSSHAVTPSRGHASGRHFSADAPRKGRINGLGFITFNEATRGFTNGRTNGKTNGRVNGRINGKVNGKTNGRTNGRVNGRTNGRTNGMTNGRTNGRINGMINGIRSGLVNGLVNGLTNGAKNGGRSGRTNGITNGFVNGAGAVNGFRLSYKHRKLLQQKPVNLKKKLVVVGAIVAILVAVPFALVYSFPSDRIEIDGYFMDWLKAQVYHDTPDAENPDISIAAYAMKRDSLGSYFYVKTQGDILRGVDDGADGFYIFIDRDDNPATGYSVRGLGADVMVQVVGWDRSVESAGTYYFNSTAGKDDFAGFKLASNAAVGIRGDQMELASSAIVNSLSRVAIVAKHTNLTSDWSEVNFRARGTSLLVVEDHDAPDVIVGTGDRHVMSLDISGKGPRAEVRYLTFDILGNLTPTFLKAYEGQRVLGVSEDNTIDLIEPMAIGTGDARTIDILATIPFGYFTGSFGLRLNSTAGLGVDNNATWLKQTIQTGSMVSYVGAAPLNITIDGAFADWSSRYPIFDQLDDAYSDKTDDFTSGDVDIQTVKVASTVDVASFYLSVNGTILGGSSVPSNLVRVVSPGGPAENVTEISLPMYGSDFAFAFIDTDLNQSTGYEVGGSEVAVAVIGKGNSIISGAAFRYENGTWVECGPVDAAIDNYQLEVSGAYSALGLTPGQTCTLTFMAQDWSGREDDVAMALIARINAGTRAFGGIMINELYNQAKKPHDWIELYNTGTAPVDIGGYELWVNNVAVFTFPSVILQPGEFYVGSGLNFGVDTYNYVLYDSGGGIVDTMQVPNWDNTNTWGRVGSPPYASIERMAGTPGRINKDQVAIPEFGDLALPLSIVPIMLFVIRRTRKSKERKKGLGGTQLG